jgi:predicted transport protein
MKLFSNWNIVYNQIKASNTSESIKTVTKFKSEINEIEKEIKTYDENYHLEWKSEKIKELYEKLKQSILNIDVNFQIIPKKMYIAFRLNNKNVVAIRLFVNSITLWIYWKHWTLEDKYNLIKNVSNLWHYWNAENEIKINWDEQLLKVLDLIQQAYIKYK